ncbi:MAG: hypothetical protein M3N16_01145 [Actinomycetota bacterium]|nr:hypothetical protein [Actinomycetota bacterium]
MTSKADFNAEEWSLVLEGPPTAGMVVMGAERGGAIRETVSMAQAYVEARQREGPSELLDAIVAEQPRVDTARYRSVEELRGEGLQRLREAVELLEQKASPEELDDYRRFVLTVAERVARAHKEGGFLGVGGQRVSDSEQAALDEVAATIGAESR